jgi:hypothetical protein
MIVWLYFFPSKHYSDLFGHGDRIHHTHILLRDKLLQIRWRFSYCKSCGGWLHDIASTIMTHEKLYFSHSRLLPCPVEANISGRKRGGVLMAVIFSREVVSRNTKLHTRLVLAALR